MKWVFRETSSVVHMSHQNLKQIARLLKKAFSEITSVKKNSHGIRRMSCDFLEFLRQDIYI